jgi:hypothetical protein
MRAIPPRPRPAVLLLMPLLATCTASPERHVSGRDHLSSASQDERLVTLLIDGMVQENR